MSIRDTIDEHIRAVTWRRAAAIEQAIEEALQGGEHGVLVDEREGWARPHVSVPYGELHHLPCEMGQHSTDW